MEESTNAPVRPTIVAWRTETSENHIRQASVDNRWHLDSQTIDGKTSIRLSNYDLLCSPSGSGATLRECWKDYLKSCDEYALKLAAIYAEAEAILANLPEDNQ